MTGDIKVNHDRIAKKCISNFTDDVDANDRIRSLIRWIWTRLEVEEQVCTAMTMTMTMEEFLMIANAVIMPNKFRTSGNSN